MPFFCFQNYNLGIKNAEFNAEILKKDKINHLKKVMVKKRVKSQKLEKLKIVSVK